MLVLLLIVLNAGDEILAEVAESGLGPQHGVAGGVCDGVGEAVLLKEELYRGESFLSETVSFGKRIPGRKVVGMGIHSGDVLVMVQVGIEILIGSGAQEALDDAGYIGI